MGVLYYRDGAVYKPLGGGKEEVLIGATAPVTPWADLWIDTSAPAPVTDWSIADNRYLLSGFRNVIRNGDMSIAQRGNGPFTSGTTADGFQIAAAGGTVNTTRVAASAGQESARLSTVVSGQSAAGDYAFLISGIENVSTLSGKQVTLSFTAYATSGSPKIAVETRQVFGTGGSPSPIVQTPISTVTIGTTAARYSLSFTVPTVTGMTIGTAGGDVLQINYWLSAGSTFASRASNIGIQNNTFSITDVQLEAGSTASPFERLPVQQQLAWCQRYFQRHGTSNPHISNGLWYLYFPASGLCASATQWGGPLVFPVIMRTAPVVSFSGVTHFAVGRIASNVASTGISTDIITGQTAAIIVTVASGLTTGQAANLVSNAGAAAYIDCSAEL